MKSELSVEEIKYLHEFAKKKGIEFVDLRIELVDHLAESILAHRAKHPNATFVQALHAVYKSFGIFGFSDIAGEHQNRMQKKYWLEIWQYFKPWLTPPKIILTALVSYLTYKGLVQIESLRVVAVILIGIVFIAGIVSTIYLYRRNKKILNGEKNVLMSGSYTGIFWYAYFFLQLPTNFRVYKFYTSDFHNSPALLTAMLLVSIIFFIANFKLQEKAKTQLLEIKMQLV